MHDVMKKRLLRKLDGLPDEQLYQVLDYIEFLESRYAARSEAIDGFQKVAERIEDRLRARSLAPRAIGGTMRLIGAAGRVIETLGEVGRGLVSPSAPSPAVPAVAGVTSPAAAAPVTRPAEAAAAMAPLSGEAQ